MSAKLILENAMSSFKGSFQLRMLHSSSMKSKGVDGDGANAKTRSTSLLAKEEMCAAGPQNDAYNPDDSDSDSVHSDEDENEGPPPASPIPPSSCAKAAGSTSPPSPPPLPPVLHIRTAPGSAFGASVASGPIDAVRVPSWNMSGATVTLGGFTVSECGIQQTPLDNSLGEKRLQGIVPDAFRTKSSCMQYIRLGIIGHGASSTVYKALHVPTLQIVAIKEIPLYERQKRHQLAHELAILPHNFVPIWVAPCKTHQVVPLLLKKPNDRHRSGRLRGGAKTLSRAITLLDARKRIRKMRVRRFQAQLRALERKSFKGGDEINLASSHVSLAALLSEFEDCHDVEDDEEDDDDDDEDDEDDDEDEDEDDDEDDDTDGEDDDEKDVDVSDDEDIGSRAGEDDGDDHAVRVAQAAGEGSEAASASHLEQGEKQQDTSHLRSFHADPPLGMLDFDFSDIEDEEDEDLEISIETDGGIRARGACPAPASVTVRRRSLKKLRRASPYMVHFRDAFTGASSSCARNRRRPRSMIGVSLVMEYMETSLGSLLDKKIKFSESMIAHVAQSGLLALAYLHAKGLIHRDVKPENFLVSQVGTVKLADFGIVSRFRDTDTQSKSPPQVGGAGPRQNQQWQQPQQGAQQHVSQKSRRGNAKSFVGTLNYMSPERINGTVYTETSDVWSLGLTCLTLAHGHFPIREQGSRAYWALVSIANGDALPDAPPIGLSETFCNFLAECLRVDPAHRPSAAKLLAHPFLCHHHEKDLGSGFRRIPSGVRPRAISEAVEGYENGLLGAGDLEEIISGQYRGRCCFDLVSENSDIVSVGAVSTLASSADVEEEANTKRVVREAFWRLLWDSARVNTDINKSSSSSSNNNKNDDSTTTGSLSGTAPLSRRILPRRAESSTTSSSAPPSKLGNSHASSDGHRRPASKEHPLSRLGKFMANSSRSVPDAGTGSTGDDSRSSGDGPKRKSRREASLHKPADAARGQLELAAAIAQLTRAENVLTELASLRRKLVTWRRNSAYEAIVYSKRDVRLLARQLRAHRVVVCSHLNLAKTVAAKHKPRHRLKHK